MLRNPDLLKIAQMTLEKKKGLDSYEKTRQAINLKAGPPKTVGTKDWKREQSESVRESAPLPRMMESGRKARDRFQTKLGQGKAWESEDGDVYGVFDKEGYSGAPDADSDEHHVTPEEFKMNAPRVAEILKMVTGGLPKPTEIGHAMVMFKERYGDTPIDPMKLKHLLTQDDEDDEATASDPKLEMMRRALQAQGITPTLPEKKAP